LRAGTEIIDSHLYYLGKNVGGMCDAVCAKLLCSARESMRVSVAEQPNMGKKLSLEPRYNPSILL
jgi:hypothetical protein